MQRSVTARTSGVAGDPRACRSSYKYVHCQEQASRGQSNLAVMVEGYSELEDNFHLLQKMFVFLNRGMKLILIRRNLSPVLLSAGFLLLH